MTRAALALCAAALGSVVRTVPAGGQTPVEHRGMPAPKYSVRLDKSTRIPMRDGVRLSTDLYFPVGVTDRLPVVLIRTPYNKNLFRPERSSGYYAWQGGDVRVQLFDGQGGAAQQVDDLPPLERLSQEPTQARIRI